MLLSGVVLSVYLAVVARALPPAEYATFGSFWAIALVLGFGAFLPLEQQMARRLAFVAGRRQVLRGGVAAAAFLAGIAVVVVAGASWLILRSIDGSTSVFLALLALCLVSAAQFLLRGILIGTNRLVRHAAVMVLDTVLRLALAVVLLLLDGSAAAFCWALVAAIVLAHVPFLPSAWRRAAGRPDPERPAGEVGAPGTRGRDLVSASVPLLVGSVCAQLLLNGLPVLVVASAATGREQAAAGIFVATFTLARAPLSVVVPLQSAIVPTLTRLLAAGRRRAVRRLLLQGAAVLSAAALVGVPLAWTAGPVVITLVFGPNYRIGAVDLAVITAGVLAHIALVILTQVHVARGRQRDVAVSWGAALGVAAVVFLAVPSAIPAAEYAFLAGSAIGAVVSSLVLFGGRPHSSPSRTPNRPNGAVDPAPAAERES